MTFAALPTKPLNTISLADADRENSMAYVVSKLGSTGATLSPEETEQIEKIGGRMIDLELVSESRWCQRQENSMLTRSVAARVQGSNRAYRQGSRRRYHNSKRDRIEESCLWRRCGRCQEFELDSTSGMEGGE